MTLKRRVPEDPAARAAAIEAFGAEADTLPVPPSAVMHEPQAAPTAVKPVPTKSVVAPGPKSKPIPIRFTEDDKLLLERVALQQGRSQNNLVLHLLIPALHALDSENE